MLYVTGITGHTGMWFLDRLERDGLGPLGCAGVRCAVRPETDASRLEASPLGIELARGSLEDEDFLARSMRGVRTVLHIASINLTPGVMRAALACGAEWAVLVHTTGRFSKYKSASAGYIEIEEAALALRGRIGVTVLRPTMIYGSSRDRNMCRLVDYLHRHRVFPVFGDGRNLMQPVHAHDLGNAYYDALAARDRTFNREYNLSGQSPIAYIDLVRTVSRALGRRNLFVKVPLGVSILGARLYNALTRRPIITVEQVLRMQEDKAFDWSDAARDFGYSPMSFEEGIAGEVREYLESRASRRGAEACGQRENRAYDASGADGGIYGTRPGGGAEDSPHKQHVGAGGGEPTCGQRGDASSSGGGGPLE